MSDSYRLAPAARDCGVTRSCCSTALSFYNAFECVIALLVGHHVNSIALFGFGLDGHG